MLVTFTEIGETGGIKWVGYEMKSSMFIDEFGKNSFEGIGKE